MQMAFRLSASVKERLAPCLCPDVSLITTRSWDMHYFTSKDLITADLLAYSKITHMSGEIPIKGRTRPHTFRKTSHHIREWVRERYFLISSSFPRFPDDTIQGGCCYLFMSLANSNRMIYGHGWGFVSSTHQNLSIKEQVSSPAPILSEYLYL